MPHRYGRYGSHAWKHLQERKYVHRNAVMPVPVAPPTTMIVRIVVPASVERTMVILMPENLQPNEAPQAISQDIQVFMSQGVQRSATEVAPPSQEKGAVQEPPEEGLPAFIRHAQWKAVSDARAIKRLTDNGNFVRIDRSKLDERIETFVHRYLENIVTNGGPSPSMQEYQTLITRFRDAYMAVLKEGISGEQGKISILYTPIEARLRCQVPDKIDTLIR